MVGQKKRNVEADRIVVARLDLVSETGLAHTQPLLLQIIFLLECCSTLHSFSILQSYLSLLVVVALYWFGVTSSIKHVSSLES